MRETVSCVQTQKRRKKEERRTSGTEEMLAEFVLSGFQEADEAGGSTICSEQGGKFTVESWEERHETGTIRKCVVVIQLLSRV